jgi:hypothetical protein
MSEEEKTNSHNVIVRLLSERPITYASAVFSLAKSIDAEELDSHDLIILGYDFNDIEPGSNVRVKPKESAAAKKFKEMASRSPGALGDLFAFVKGYKWYQIYIGFAGAVLFGTLLFKWAVRLITGNF